MRTTTMKENPKNITQGFYDYDLKSHAVSRGDGDRLVYCTTGVLYESYKYMRIYPI